ncbi:MotA/TolQ/ExbB proton channel family protein [uncultured Helicobacter sp.]|uniref:MotA/TolQ/ExbB proton channel family protein n=1 Tax=uncultured Helicobacter sp. TaxID=175537 RepID=UPI0037516402
MDTFLVFIAQSTPVTLVVLGWLSLYFLTTLWIYIYKTFTLGDWLSREQHNVDLLSTSPVSIPKNAILATLLNSHNIIDADLLQVWKTRAIQKATRGLVFLSIISSTAPFIGLFGTVVEILEAFSHLGGGNVSFDIIAPVISKALVATACGILVAIPAYSFYLLLKRKAYNIGVCIQMQINLMLSSQRNSL